MVLDELIIVITYKRGKFTEAEKAAVKEHLETFKRVRLLLAPLTSRFRVSLMTSCRRSWYQRVVMRGASIPASGLSVLLLSPVDLYGMSRKPSCASTTRKRTRASGLLRRIKRSYSELRSGLANE